MYKAKTEFNNVYVKQKCLVKDALQEGMRPLLDGLLALSLVVPPPGVLV